MHYSEFVGSLRSATGLRTAIAGPLGSPMHNISKKLAKREKRARFTTSEREKYFGVASGSDKVSEKLDLGTEKDAFGRLYLKSVFAQSSEYEIQSVK